MQCSGYHLAGVLALVTLVVYIPALRNGFVWDDEIYIVNNPFQGTFDASFLGWAFTGYHGGNWHPLTMLSHALDQVVWELDPFGHHLSSILLHAVNTALVVLVILGLIEAANARRGMTGPHLFFHRRSMLIAAGTTGLLFGLHPLHVESAAWVSERKDLLCALFVLLSIGCYTRYVREITTPANPSIDTAERVNKQFLLAAGCFLLALMSKPMAVTLPVIMLLLDWYPFMRIVSARSFWAVLNEKLPLLFFSIAASVIAVFAQDAAGALASPEFAPLSTRLLAAARSLIAYLGKMVMPTGLSPYYPYPKDVTLLSPEFGAALVMVMVITALCMILRTRHKVWLTAWAFYVISLMPVLGIVQVGEQSMADRYTYLPGLAPFFLAGVAIAWAQNKAERYWTGPRMIQTSAAAFMIALFTVLALLTNSQIRVWSNEITLWTRVIERYSDTAWLAYYNRGIEYGRAGLIDQAIVDFDSTVNIRPNHAEAFGNRGTAHAIRGQYDRALADYQSSLELNGSNAAVYANRGKLYQRMGKTALAHADLQKACGMGDAAACKAL